MSAEPENRIRARCWTLLAACMLLRGSALGAGAQAQAPAQIQTQPAPQATACALTNAGSTADSSDDASAQKARTILNEAIQALGGNTWLVLRNSYYEGRTAGFYQGRPTGATTDFFQFVEFPDHERDEFTKKHDVIHIFTGNHCWEVTYKGKHALPKDQCDDYLRRRDHSVELALRVWYQDPQTILLYDGQRLAERHLTDQVTMISPSNDSITLQFDADTHLPLRRVFQWRDPLYKDKNEEVEEFDDYHPIEGIPTPFSITRFHNGDMTSQRFLTNAAYNIKLPDSAFDPDAAAKKIRK